MSSQPPNQLKQRSIPLPPQTRFRPGPNVVAQFVGSELMAVNMNSGRIYELNSTGARLWELLAEGCARSEAEAALLTEFDVDAGLLAAEVSRTLHELISEGLLQVVDDLTHDYPTDGA